MSWYYAAGDEQKGPVTEEELAQLVQQGTITNSSLVWQEGMADWVPYSTTGLGGAGTAGIVCAECGGQFDSDSVVRISNQFVCAACKPVFVQRLQEGGVASGTLEYAGFWIRLGARVLDGIILNIVNAGVIFLIGATMGGDSSPDAMMQIQLIGVGVNLLIAVVYETLFIGKFGATPGKMALKLKVVRPDGQPISYLRSFGRHWATALSAMILGIGYLMAAFDREEHRALHDRICDTRVVRV